MNYLTEILAFNDLLQTNELSTGQIALWYALMHVNNKCGWREWFPAPNRTLELYSGLSRSGIEKNRNVLKQKGLIDFRTKGTKASEYKILTMSKSVQDSTQDSLQDSLQRCTQDSLQDSLQNSGTLNKQKEININQTDLTENVFGYCERVLNTVISPKTFAELESYLADGVEPTLIMAAIDEAAKKGTGWNYARGMLNNLMGQGIKSFSVYKSRMLARKQPQERETDSDISVYVPYHVRRENHA